MFKKVLCICGAMLFSFSVFGCSSGYETVANETGSDGMDFADDGVSYAPSATSEAAEEKNSYEDSADYIGTIYINEAQITLGMTTQTILEKLEEKDVVFSQSEVHDFGYDESTDETFSITLTDDACMSYYLGFKDDKLSYIIYNGLMGTDEEWLKENAEVLFYVYDCCPLPVYKKGENKDVFVYNIDGTYYTQIHNKNALSGGENYISFRLSLEDNTSNDPDIMDSDMPIYVLSDYAQGLYENKGIGFKAAIDIVRDKFGTTNSQGAAQDYYGENVVLYNQKLWYNIAWTQLATGESEELNSSFNGNILVSLDGSETVQY